MRNNIESLSYLKRYRKPEDERLVIVEITEKEIALREKAEQIPYQLVGQLNKRRELFTEQEVKTFKEQLYKLLEALEQTKA